MAELRTMACDIKGCTCQKTEDKYGDGFPGWGSLHGIALNGIPNPALCPQHLAKVADFVDSLGVEDGLDES